MKKIISTVLVYVLLLGTVFVLASCAGIDDGTYVNATSGAEIEISGNTLVITKQSGEGSINGEYTYEIKDDETNPDKQTIVLTPASEGEAFTLSYEKREDAIVINGTKYTKK